MLKIDINLQPSKMFITWVSSLLLLTAIIIFTLPISFWIKLLMLISALSYGANILYFYGFLSHSASVTHISFNEEGWMIWDKTNCYAVTLCGSSTVTTMVTILRFKVADKRRKRASIVFRDSIKDHNMYKKLMALTSL